MLDNIDVLYHSNIRINKEQIIKYCLTIPAYHMNKEH